MGYGPVFCVFCTLGFGFMVGEVYREKVHSHVQKVLGF